MHGMAEHVDRYDAFAGFLNQNGIAVAAADMARHVAAHRRQAG
jgi:alpha-beta hydrolase superfamily lysophospholipase